MEDNSLEKYSCNVMEWQTPRSIYVIQLLNLPTRSFFKRLMIVWLKQEVEKKGVIFYKFVYQQNSDDYYYDCHNYYYNYDYAYDYDYDYDNYDYYNYDNLCCYLHFTSKSDYDGFKNMKHEFELFLRAPYQYVKKGEKKWTRNDFMKHHLHCIKCGSAPHDIDDDSYCGDCLQKVIDIRRKFLVPKGNDLYEKWEKLDKKGKKNFHCKEKKEIQKWLNDHNIDPIKDIHRMVYYSECTHQRNNKEEINTFKNFQEPRNLYCKVTYCTYYHNVGQRKFGKILCDIRQNLIDNNNEKDNYNDDKKVDNVVNFIEPKIDAIYKEIEEEQKAYDMIDLSESNISISKDKDNEKITYLHFNNRDYTLKKNDTLVLSNFRLKNFPKEYNGLEFSIMRKNAALLAKHTQTLLNTQAIKVCNKDSKIQFTDLCNENKSFECVADIHVKYCDVSYQKQIEHLESIMSNPFAYPHFDICLNRLKPERKSNIDIDPGSIQLVQDIKNEFLNTKQQEAVDNILNYNVSITQGPPGTGKTRTIAVAILCHKLLYPKEKILAMAPSNVGADNILRMIDRIRKDNFFASNKKIQELNISRILAQKLINTNIYNDDIIHYCSYFKAEQTLNALNDICTRKKTIEELSLDIKDVIEDEDKLLREAFEESSINIKRDLAEILKKKPSDCLKLLEKIHIAKSDIIITTPTLAHLKCENIPFSLRILDEANQSSMSESLLALIRTTCKRIALVGDIQQLEPVLKTEMGIKHLKTSLLKLFQVNYGFENIIQLQEQYRMATKISGMSSRTFYFRKPLYDSKEIQNKIRMLNRKQYKNLKNILICKSDNGLENVDVSPIMFFNCDDEENEECTILQSIIAYNLLKKLICNGKFREEDCCILSYYQAQTKHLLTYGHSLDGAWKLMREYYKKKQVNLNLKEICDKALREYNSREIREEPFDLSKVVIDNVDAVEGQEKNCVIILTTRSNPNGKLGFVANPNRLNVAISRTKQLCFIVGNAKTLANNEYWNSILHYIHNECNSFGYFKYFDDESKIIEYDKQDNLPFLEFESKSQVSSVNNHKDSVAKRCKSCASKLLYKFPHHEFEIYCHTCWFSRNKLLANHLHYKNQYIIIDLSEQYEKYKHKIIQLEVDLEIQKILDDNSNLLQFQVYENKKKWPKICKKLWEEFQLKDKCDKEDFITISKIIRNHLMDEMKRHSSSHLPQLFNNYNQFTFGEKLWWKKNEFKKFSPVDIVAAAIRSKLKFSYKKIADLERYLVDYCKKNINILTKANELLDKCGINIRHKETELAVRDLLQAMEQDSTSLYRQHKSKEKATEKEYQCENLLNKLKKRFEKEGFDFLKEDLQENRTVDFLFKKPLMLKLTSEKYYIIYWIDVKNYYISCANSHKPKQLNHQIGKFNSQYGPGCYLCSAGVNSIYSEMEFKLLGTCVLPYEILKKYANEEEEKEITNNNKDNKNNKNKNKM